MAGDAAIEDGQLNPDRQSPVLRALYENLGKRDDATRIDRARRMAELMLLGEPAEGRMLFGDSQDALYEAQWSYIQGCFLAAILTTQACLEKLLSGLIDTLPGGSAETQYARLLAAASERGFLSEHEHALFDRLRRARNPHAHYRNVNHPEHRMRRAISDAQDPDELVAQDARTAVCALVNLVNRPPFALGSVVLPFSETDLLPAVHANQLDIFDQV